MFSVSDEFEKNRKCVSTNQEFTLLNETLMELRDFLNDLGYLTFNKDIAFFRRIGPISGNIILDSAARTMESIRCCCMNANFADAYTLLRKYRDDLFYYVYLFAVADRSDFTQYVELEQLSKNEKNVWDWVHNQQEDLYIGAVLECIGSHPSAKKAVQKFKLQKSFDELAYKLNNYVHANGRLYYNEPYASLLSKQKIKELCNEFSDTAIFITIAFLFVIVLIHPIFIMSSDYTDCLEVGMKPPEGSEYWVAPFVSDFIKKHNNVLGERLDDCLREITGMQI